MTDTEELIGPLLGNRPVSVAAHDAERFVAARYGIEGIARVLTAERDHNFHIMGGDGDGFVLKLSHPAENPNTGAFQTRVLDHIARVAPDLPVPHVVPTLAGERQTHFPTGDAAGRTARLFAYLPGTLLHELTPGIRLLGDLGKRAAQLDRALGTFPVAEDDTNLLWNFDKLSSLRPLLENIAGDPVRRLVAAALDAFDARAADELHALPRQLIHNDLNPHNVLVDPGSQRVTGILDFGDLVQGPRVGELAIAICYHLCTDGDPLAAAASCVGGFHAGRPLTEHELDLLPVFVAGRLAMTVLITEWRARHDPANAAYILRNNPTARRGLECLAGFADREIRALLASRCGDASAP
jgi:Ser/Thr protein kinase RdoA (MazF antagonist)